MITSGSQSNAPELGETPRSQHPIPHREGVGRTPESAHRIRVVCVDDHQLLLEGLKVRFAQEPDLELVATLTDPDRLIETVERLRPDIVVTDLQMPGAEPISMAEEIQHRWPECRVVILTGHLRDQDLTAACRAGVWGFYTKSDGLRDLIDGLRRVHRGEFVLGSAAAARSRPLKNWPRRPNASVTESKLESLTPREREVLELIGNGLSRINIAETLGRSAKTIDGHRERIMEKLDIHSSPELVRFAIREGLTDI
jgi:two-component system response regulator NreC